MHCKSYDSLHKKIAEKIDYEERLFELFKSLESGAVYMHKAWRQDKYDYSDTVFSSLEKAMDDARDSWERDEEILVVKAFIDGNNERKIEAWFDYDGSLHSLSAYGYDDKLFTDIASDDIAVYFEQLFYIDIPVPFKRGDILTARYGLKDDAIVFVLDWLDRYDQERLVRRLSGEFGDGTDMIGWGLFVDDDGILYGDHAMSYDYFEYYRGKLEDKERILHYVSLFLKDEIDLPALLTMQCRIIMEHHLDNGLRVDSHGCYIPENLLAENRLTQEDAGA
jgi:hypothetical protein